MLEQAAAALARALGLKRQQQYQEALEQVEQALAALVHVDRGMLASLDTKTLLSLLGPPEVARTVARACQLRGELLECLGRDTEARASFSRALALYGEVGPGQQPEDMTAVRQLVERFSAEKTTK